MNNDLTLTGDIRIGNSADLTVPGNYNIRLVRVPPLATLFIDRELEPAELYRAKDALGDAMRVTFQRDGEAAIDRADMPGTVLVVRSLTDAPD